MKRISSRDNPFFKALRALVEDHREPRRRGETLIDGIHLLQTCIDRGIALRQLVVSTSGALHPEVIAILEHCAAEPVELTDALFRDATGEDHLGVVVGSHVMLTAPWGIEFARIDHGGVLLTWRIG